MALPCSKSDICCCSDLQTVTRNSQASLSSHRARNRRRKVTTLPDVQDTEAIQEQSTAPDVPLAKTPDKRMHSPPSLPLEETSNERGILHESLGHTVPMATVPSSEDTEAGPAYSDEDYEEDIIEPRTLNEITTVTDKTSPWSSFVSDTSEIINLQPSEIQREGTSCPSPESCPRQELEVRSSFLSISERAVNPYLHDQDSKSQNLAPYALGASKARVGDSASPDPQLIPPLTASGTQESNTLVGWSSPEVDQDKEPESQAQAENESAFSELSDSVDSFKEFPLHLASQSRRESHTESPIGCPNMRQETVTSGSEVSTRQSFLLPEPIVVPNFFLPPQQLEASIRMLSLSATLPPPVTTDQDKNETTREALSRRTCRPRPISLPPNLPEEETRRIARIFSSQYSQKD